MRALGLLVTLLAACGSAPRPDPTPALGVSHAEGPVGAQPLALPVFPGAIQAGAPEGSGPITQTWIANASIVDVRAFYTPPHLPGFQVDIEEGSREHPRHIVDGLGHRSYELAVYEDNGATMIAITTAITP